MIKKICVLIIYFILFPTSATAADFATHIDQTYTLTVAGATVAETITITNLSDLTYPTSYSQVLYSDQLQSVSITNAQNQPVNFDQTPIAATTKINLHFRQPTVGKGKTQTYRLEYTSPEIRPDPHSAQYVIPHNQTPDTDINTTVIIPNAICPNPLIFPASISLNRQDSFASISYTQSELNHAVTILCQPKRYVNLTLTYQLVNPSLTPVETQITLPPDTAYQRLVFNSIVPAPLRQTTDVDGNRIATYRLEPKQSNTVTVTASAEITNAGDLYRTDLTNSKLYITDQPHWPASNHQIKQLVKSLPTAESIYQYVLTHARYNPDQFNQSTARHSGQVIITAPNNLTAEDFTDVFITLCRAAGIPSRRVISFVPSNNQKLYPQEYPDQSIHVYPEWYDSVSQTWQQVDPFWQTTNPFQNFWPVTDQLRITLAINGANDAEPYPANSISVIDTAAFSFPTPTLTATLQNSLLNKLFPNHANLMITNHSNFALYREPFTLYADQKPVQSFTLNRLDINDSSIIPLTINTHQSLTVKSNYGTIPIQQTFVAVSPTAAVTACLVAVAGVFAVISRRLLVSRRKR